ncbi:hypothetical protein [Sphingobacterium faecium]|uniref:hypothetical protein n=1 Tax=Sphingobacterium faecium TaxID=34087 RepID=UPI002468C03E|nr:hypothetical protein [Sphingobacterium faecium]MDH5825798.1 hypothetical protein [Sphingobacterium faecium]
MKGFIEVTNSSTGNKECININHIVKFSDSWITVTEMQSIYECSGTNFQYKFEESYEQIKELIKKSSSI